MKKKRKKRSNATLSLTPASGVPARQVEVVAEGGKCHSDFLKVVPKSCRSLIENTELSKHSLEQAKARGIKIEWIWITLAWGRMVYHNGAVKFAFGRKEIAQLRYAVPYKLPPDGIIIVCSYDTTVITAYFDKKLKCLREQRKPRRRKRRAMDTSQLGSEV